MQFITPEVYQIAKTAIDQEGLDATLKAIGAEDWESDAPSDAELLTEVAGRLCYKSFGTELNPNVTKVRSGNKGYIGNVLAQKHGSVIEHASVSFAFLGVSRVFTHEMVRHRHGSPSQESLRFVRLDKLTAYYPEIGFGQETLRGVWDGLSDTAKDRAKGSLMLRTDTPDADAREAFARANATALRSLFTDAFNEAERIQRGISKALFLDECSSFAAKKKVTSAMRRLVPDGLGTAIIYTCNHRALRDIIEKRTSRHAEEEIRIVFAKVFDKVHGDNPNLYQDALRTRVDGLDEITFANSRV